MLLIARTDAESGKLISTSVDSKDHEFILGTTNRTKALAEILADAEAKGLAGKQLEKVEAEWTADNKLVTFSKGPHVSLFTSTFRLTCNSQRLRLP